MAKPGLMGLFAGGLIGLGSWYAATLGAQALAGDVLPLPGPQMQALVEEMMRLAQDPATAPWLYVGAALAPALCEELLFRGALLSALRRAGSDRMAVVVSAVAFSMMHMNVHQMPTTLVLGVVLAALVIRSGSVWPAIVLHALHNGLALGLQVHLGDALLEDPRWSWVLAGPLVGFMLLWRLDAKEET